MKSAIKILVVSVLFSALVMMPSVCFADVCQEMRDAAQGYFKSQRVQMQRINHYEREIERAESHYNSGRTTQSVYRENLKRFRKEIKVSNKNIKHYQKQIKKLEKRIRKECR